MNNEKHGGATLKSAQSTRRIALIGIIVKNSDSVEKLNSILHQFRNCIIGRMGVPCAEIGVSIISIAVMAEEDAISALAGKIGMIDNVSTKTTYLKAS